MSNYTTQVRNIVENYTFNMIGQPIGDRIKTALPLIFDFNFPIWNNDYKIILEEKIIRHYFTKEIGLETISLWKFYLEERLNLIMPYYNNLYLTTVKNYDYMSDIDYTESNIVTHHEEKISDTIGNSTQTDGGTETNWTTDNGTSKNLKSDLPQANFNNLDYGTGLEEVENSNTTHNTNDRNNTTDVNANSKTTDSSTKNDNATITKKGSTGGRSFTQLLIEYRDSLINIDKMVIDELYDLFMLIY